MSELEGEHPTSIPLGPNLTLRKNPTTADDTGPSAPTPEPRPARSTARRWTVVAAVVALMMFAGGIAAATVDRSETAADGRFTAPPTTATTAKTPADECGDSCATPEPPPPSETSLPPMDSTTSTSSPNTTTPAVAPTVAAAAPRPDDAPPTTDTPVPTSPPAVERKNCRQAFDASPVSVGEIALSRRQAQVLNDISYPISADPQLCAWEVGWYSFDGVETWYVARRLGPQTDGRHHFQSYIGGPGEPVPADTEWVRKLIACTTDACNKTLADAIKGDRHSEATAVRVAKLHGSFVELRSTKFYGPNLSSVRPG